MTPQLFSLFFLLAFSCASAAQGTVPPVQNLDRSLEPAGRPQQSIAFQGNKSVNIHYSLQDMTISTDWIWKPADLPNGELLEQAHAVPYRPTATQTVPGTTSFCVAGVGASTSQGGSTVIELWTLGPPVTKRVGQPSSGNVHYVVIPGPVLSRTTLFHDEQGINGPVNYFLVNHGEPGSLFLQFLGSRSVHKLIVATGAMSLALPGSAFPIGLRGFTGMLEVDSPDKGYVYVLLEDLLDTPGPRTFVMTDPNRAGILSSVVEVSFSELESLGYFSDSMTILNHHIEWPPWF